MTTKACTPGTFAIIGVHVSSFVRANSDKIATHVLHNIESRLAKCNAYGMKISNQNIIVKMI